MRRHFTRGLLIDSGGNPSDVDRRIAERALRRGQRLLWLLSAISAITWLVAFGGLVLFYVVFVTFLLPRIHEALSGPFDPEVTPGVWHTTVRSLLLMSQPIVWTSAIAAVLAVSATIALVLYGRRVTLRQISQGLAEISRQLEELRSRQNPGPADDLASR